MTEPGSTRVWKAEDYEIDDITLSPCPFCDNPDVDMTEYNAMGYHLEFEVRCWNMQCNARAGRSDKSPYEAAERWNRRPKGM